MQHEFIIYLHGVLPHRQGRDHSKKYRKLHRGIKYFLTDPDERERWENAQICMTEWGWQTSDDIDLGNHRYLSAAQDSLGSEVLDIIKSDYLIPYRPQVFMRHITLFGLSDMFYYVSLDGKNSVRSAISGQIAAALGDKLLDDPDALISLTMIGHSAGSVVAFDLAFYLFSGKGDFIHLDFEKREDPLYRQKFSSKVVDETHRTVVRLQKLKKIANEGRLRIRRLFTFGSPLSILAYRNDPLVELLSKGNRIDPALHGLTANGKPFSDHLEGPRWVNVWDRDDPISFPVAPMLQESDRDIALDVQINTTLWPFRSHTAYWSSRKVQTIFARNW